MCIVYTYIYIYTCHIVEDGHIVGELAWFSNGLARPPLSWHCRPSPRPNLAPPCFMFLLRSWCYPIRRITRLWYFNMTWVGLLARQGVIAGAGGWPWVWVTLTLPTPRVSIHIYVCVYIHIYIYIYIYICVHPPGATLVNTAPPWGEPSPRGGQRGPASRQRPLSRFGLCFGRLFIGCWPPFGCPW